MMDTKPTERQLEILNTLKKLEKRVGPPTQKELREALGLSSNGTLTKHLNNMESKRLLKRDYKKSKQRNIVILVNFGDAR